MTNIILMNCDDLGYGDLGCYGSQVNRSPHIDRMAAEGMRCTDFYAASPVCSPSRGAMMTGCYPPRIGFTVFGPESAGVLRPGHGDGLAPTEITMAEALRRQGYKTALIGKWHCGDQEPFLPLQHGFDYYYYGLPFSNDMGRQAQDGEDRPPLPLMAGNEVLEEQPDQATLTSRYVERSIEFIRENRQGPFFLYFAHMHTHLPLYAPDPFCRRSENGDYGACVEEIDWSVAALRSELRRVDYALLGTFVAFFVFIGNMGRMEWFRALLDSVLLGREAVEAVAASQVVSNVPAVLLLSGFTERWDALIVGCNLGGLGTLIASMASLISYKQVALAAPGGRKRYLLLFTACNVGLLSMLLGLYALLSL